MLILKYYEIVVTFYYIPNIIIIFVEPKFFEFSSQGIQKNIVLKKYFNFNMIMNIYIDKSMC